MSALFAGKMNFIWNITISWLLLQFLVPAHSYQNEVTFPIISPTITLQCENELRISNIEVALRQRNTTCSTTPEECTLPNDAIVIIKDECNKKVSCAVDIRSFTNNQSCLHEYGYFNVVYTCRTKIDYSCDFESDLCNWAALKNSRRFQWKRGLRPKQQEPTIDHTSASTEGNYAYILAANSRKNDFAMLESGYIIGTEQQCLSFWYFSTNYRDSVNVYHNGENLLDLSAYTSGKWHHIQRFLRTSNTVYKLAFKVKREDLSNDLYGAIVIDDILLENRNCNSSILECDFGIDSYPCKGYIHNANRNIWFNQSGNSINYYTGPKYDHSKASDGGHYMYLDSAFSDRSVETTVYLEFPYININLLGYSCFSFWYYMHGDGKGGLRVTIGEQNNNFVWTKFADKDDKWQHGLIDMKGNLTNVNFIGIIGTDWLGDIAIDDLHITEGTCEGLFDQEELCDHVKERAPYETICPSGYFDFTNLRLSFDPEKRECSELYKQIKVRILQECRDRNDLLKCSIDLSIDINSHPECFQVYELRILHTCEEEETTTVVSDSTSGRDSSIGEKTTTVLSDTTLGGDLSTVSDGRVNLPRVMKTSSEPATGLIVGLVIGALFVLCVVILIVVFIRRLTFKSNPSEKIGNNLRENDYIGSQDIALPLTAYHSKQMQNTGIYNKGSDTSIHGHDSTNANAHINNVQHEYTNVDAVNGFVNKEKVQRPAYAHHKDKIFADNHMPNDDEYAIVDPTAETSFNETTDNRTGTAADSYMVLDPTQTGFNRQIFSNTPVGYEFAMPIEDTEKNNRDEDQYAIYDGVYDHSGNNRHKKSENSIYNHAVDTIYDSGSHKRKNKGTEDTYDHFFGQKTEDDYDISTTT